MLFARNVRSLMADRLGVPISDWTREIGFLYEELINLDLPVDLLAFDYFDMTKETGLGLGFQSVFEFIFRTNGSFFTVQQALVKPAKGWREMAKIMKEMKA